MKASTPPILYSFRRCPYAMRARMALAISGVEVALREVVLRDKPAEMLAASPKGTVPVLILPDGEVIDESLDIMHWALGQNDPENWLGAEVAARLIAHNDGPFKAALDTYKYANRKGQEETDRLSARAEGRATLGELDAQISAHGGQLLSPHRSLADIAIFPFIRQFANTDRDWFDAETLLALQAWLSGHLTSELFQSVMHKCPQWKSGEASPPFPVAT